MYRVAEENMTTYLTIEQYISITFVAPPPPPPPYMIILLDIFGVCVTKDSLKS